MVSGAYLRRQAEIGWPAIALTLETRDLRCDKQKTALEIIAQWADRFECVTSAVIYGSVARGDEAATSDLDVDLEYVPDLTAPGMVGSYKDVQDSFADLSDKILHLTAELLPQFSAVGHFLTRRVISITFSSSVTAT
jgi:predicted nucleotidyltransferase